MDTITETRRPRAWDPSQTTPGAVPPTPGWDMGPEHQVGDGRGLAGFLGWLSIGLGLSQAAAPDRFAEWLGMEDRTELIRAYGVGKIGTGIGILSQSNPAPWIWARVGGDALDLATLATRAGDDNPRTRDVWTAIAVVGGIALLDLACAGMLARKSA
jgi:hypothetical protein